MMPTFLRPAGVSAALFVAMMFQTWMTGNEVRSGAEPRKTAAIQTLACPGGNDCLPIIDGVRMHWVSRTDNGDLYLLVRAECPERERCDAWFVERTARGMTARLGVDGRFRVLHNGSSVPDVQAWRAVSENEFEVTRYRWAGGVFSRTETRTVYIVDGEECGSAADCHHKARSAHDQRHTGRALRIWEKVHNLSFI